MGTLAASSVEMAGGGGMRSAGAVRMECSRIGGALGGGVAKYNAHIKQSVGGNWSAFGHVQNAARCNPYAMGVAGVTFAKKSAASKLARRGLTDPLSDRRGKRVPQEPPTRVRNE